MDAREYRPAGYPPELQRRIDLALSITALAVVCVIVLLIVRFSEVQLSSAVWWSAIAAAAVCNAAAALAWRRVRRTAARLGLPAILPDTELAPTTAGRTAAPLRIQVAPPRVEPDDVLLAIFAALILVFIPAAWLSLQGVAGVALVCALAVALALVLLFMHQRRVRRRWRRHPDAAISVMDAHGWHLPAHLVHPPLALRAPAVTIPWDELRLISVEAGGSDDPDTFELDLHQPVIERRRRLSVLRRPFGHHQLLLLERARAAGVPVRVRATLSPDAAYPGDDND